MNNSLLYVGYHKTFYLCIKKKDNFKLVHTEYILLFFKSEKKMGYLLNIE